jgi:hypothetical protein
VLFRPKDDLAFEAEMEPYLQHLLPVDAFVEVTEGLFAGARG